MPKLPENFKNFMTTPEISATSDIFLNFWNYIKNSNLQKTPESSYKLL
jgi:hypothetical protein